MSSLIPSGEIILCGNDLGIIIFFSKYTLIFFFILLKMRDKLTLIDFKVT